MPTTSQADKLDRLQSLLERIMATLDEMNRNVETPSRVQHGLRWTPGRATKAQRSYGTVDPVVRALVTRGSHNAHEVRVGGRALTQKGAGTFSSLFPDGFTAQAARRAARNRDRGPASTTLKAPHPDSALVTKQATDAHRRQRQRGLTRCPGDLNLRRSDDR